MTRRKLGYQVLLVALAAAWFWQGGCPGRFERSLPNNLDGGIKYVVDHARVFRHDATGLDEAGVVRDELSGVAGCWGAFVEADGGRGQAGQMVLYTMLHLARDGSYNSWNVVNLGSIVVSVYGETGRYQAVSENRLRLTANTWRTYNTTTRQYESQTSDGASATEYLATLSGARLRLLMLDSPGAEPPDAAGPDRSVVYVQFACVP